jgi:hypothetical protein
MEQAAKVFWLTMVVAVPLAFLPHPGLVRWAAIGWLALIGVMCALGNWVMIAACVTGRRSGSMIPLLGTLFLGATVAAVPANVVGRWIIWGLFLDPWSCAIALWPIARMFKRRTR